VLTIISKFSKQQHVATERWKLSCYSYSYCRRRKPLHCNSVHKMSIHCISCRSQINTRFTKNYSTPLRVLN